MSMPKVAHVNTSEPPEPCVLCEKPTTYRAVWKPAILPLQLRKAVCPDCIQDFLRTGRFVANLLGSIETGTRKLKGEDEP